MNKILTILVHGLIGSYLNAEGKKIKGVELEDIVAQAKKNPDFDEVHVKINSSGGNAQAGFDIYHYLKSLGKPITTMVEGRCESIATVIALAGDTRTITADSIFMIHNPWMELAGDADQVAAAAKELKAVEDQIINFYHEHTGIEKTALDAMMKKETEMNPTIAVDTKFMTEMVSKVEAFAYVPERKLNIVAIKANPVNDFMKKMEQFMSGAKNIFNQKNVTWTLADGTQIMIDTEDGTPAVGNEVTKGGQALEDGTHKLLDGGSMTIAGGKISVLTPKEDPAGGGEGEGDKPTDPVTAAALAKLTAENEALRAQVTGITEAQNVGNAGMLAMMKQLQIMGASMESGYKPETETPVFNKSGQVVDTSENCVTGIGEREKEYKGYKKPE